MTKSIPECLMNHILPFNWNVRKVWSLEAAIVDRPRTEFDYLLDLPLWSSIQEKGMLFDISPIEVIRNPTRSPYQNRRLNATNINYPMDFLIFKGKSWILDGVHRLAKHRMINSETIKIRFHEESSISRITIGK